MINLPIRLTRRCVCAFSILNKGTVCIFSAEEKRLILFTLTNSLWDSLLTCVAIVPERASVPVGVQMGGILPLYQNLLTISGFSLHTLHLILFLSPLLVGTTSMFLSAFLLLESSISVSSASLLLAIVEFKDEDSVLLS